MSAHLLFFFNACILLIILMLPSLSPSNDLGLPTPTLGFDIDGWREGFRAGENKAIKIEVYVDFKSEQDKHSFNPKVSMNGVMGNSSLITGLWCDMNNLKIYFIPIMVGKFDVLITESRFHIYNRMLTYHVTPAPIYEPAGIVSWMGQVQDCVAGSKLTLLILPTDAFGNNVTVESEGQNIYNFDVFATHLNGSSVTLLDVSNKGWNEFGYVSVEFVVVTAGHLLVHVKHKSVSLNGSPLRLTVQPDELYSKNCSAHWRTETKSFQLNTIMDTFITQRDKFGNLIPWPCEFNIQLTEKGSHLPLPLRDLQHKEVSTGIQSFSYNVSKLGEFELLITDQYANKIKDMPYEFVVFTGYCYGDSCDDREIVLNGTGLNDSVAGDYCYFRILLKDVFHYPLPIELEWLQVDITMPALSLKIETEIMANDFVNGTPPIGLLEHDAFAPWDYGSKTNDFDVLFYTYKSGVYEIRIYCGNVPLNGGRPFIKSASAGQVDLSHSGVVRYDKNVSSGVQGHLTVQLLDEFDNPVMSQETRLKLSFAAKKGSFFQVYLFSDNHDGTYLGSYIAFTPGDYKFTVSYDGNDMESYIAFNPGDYELSRSYGRNRDGRGNRNHFEASPFEIHVFFSYRFPNAEKDSYDVWEDQSTAFNALENDYTVSGTTVAEIQMPSHGSVLQYGTLFRYTPFKGYYGYDKFLYTITSGCGNATAEVTIHVLTYPPQFVSSPKQLQAVEDTLSPQFGGFPSFEIKYSDLLENISLMLTAHNGTVFLSIFLMQLLDPIWGELAVSKVDGRDECLYITGRSEVINFALKSLQYIGNANFSGNDNIEITSINRYGKGHLNVPIYVESTNDPPFINAPEFIIMENDKDNKGIKIFDRQRDSFNFSVGDPDYLFYPEIESFFRVMFSVEVSSGTLSAMLPAQLLSSTESKMETSKQWQPLQTFVEISKQFNVKKVKGIRFRGTINECNILLHRLVYYSDKQDAILEIRVNDMGWYGCYPDCSEMMSAALMSEATVNLLRRTPMNALLAHSLGSLIVLESILLSSCAMILMFFTCKCVIVLSRGKTKQQVESQNLQVIEVKNSDEPMSSTGLPENTNQLTGSRSSSFRQSEPPPNLPKPAEETNVADVATVIL